MGFLHKLIRGRANSFPVILLWDNRSIREQKNGASQNSATKLNKDLFCGLYIVHFGTISMNPGCQIESTFCQSNACNCLHEPFYPGNPFQYSVQTASVG